jgi:hypothetical protein
MDFKSRMQAGNSENWQAEKYIFCESNIAVYGPCIASSSRNIQLAHVSAQNAPKFPGLPFQINAAKKDFYNQTILSDSSTLLQIQVVHGGHTSSDHSAVLSGTPVFKLQAGTATVSLAVIPMFSEFIPAAAVAIINKDINIFIAGIDSETFLPLQSPQYLVKFGSNLSICPPGYVLDLVVSNASDAAFKGSCKFCQPGSYSLNPLFSASGAYPACLVCPSAGICNGGDNIKFMSGQWTVQAGMYELVSCPRGSQLINSVKGTFYQESQNCVPCKVNQYILRTDDPKFECQPCPLGAVCNGSSLNGTVKGATWSQNMESGQYILTSCPPGYEILNTDKRGSFSAENQECHLCPALFYCLGGSTSRLVCPSGSFAEPGANSTDACIPSIFVALTMTFALTPNEFESEQQRGFQKAVAYVAETDAKYVVIESIFQMRRSSLPAGIQVKVSIATNDERSAASVSNRITDVTLNRQLAAQGMITGKLVSVAVQNPSAQNPGLSSSMLIGLVVGVAFLLLAGLGVGYFITKTGIPEEEQKLIGKVNELRILFKISRKDGYILSSEDIPWWRRREDYTIIHKSYMEATARLGLFWDFEVAKFDAFCLCLELTYSTSRAAVSPAYGPRNTQKESPSPYSAVCEWLLDISRELIKPNINCNESYEANSDGIQSPKCSLRAEERFPYLKQKVCRVRLWSENDGELFDKLKAAVQLYMHDIARLCDDRFQSLCGEPGGEELIAFYAVSNEGACNSLIGGHIRRQDCNEVCGIKYHSGLHLPCQD